jgi:hypothetical protein
VYVEKKKGGKRRRRTSDEDNIELLFGGTVVLLFLFPLPFGELALVVWCLLSCVSVRCLWVVVELEDVKEGGWRSPPSSIFCSDTYTINRLC